MYILGTSDSLMVTGSRVQMWFQVQKIMLRSQRMLECNSWISLLQEQYNVLNMVSSALISSSAHINLWYPMTSLDDAMVIRKKLPQIFYFVSKTLQMVNHGGGGHAAPTHWWNYNIYQRMFDLWAIHWLIHGLLSSPDILFIDAMSIFS